MGYETAIKTVEAIGVAVAALGGVYFGFVQTKINKRAVQLADYVAVTIEPSQPSGIAIANAGRVNMYLHKWEIGSTTESFTRPWLLPVDSMSKITTQLLSNGEQPRFGQQLIKLYLTDETDRKFITLGELSVMPIGIEVPSGSVPEAAVATIPPGSTAQRRVTTRVAFMIRAWAYKTEQENWVI